VYKVKNMLSENMDYFLPLNEINNTKENSLDGIKCVAQYSITEEEGESLNGKVTIKNHSIICQESIQESLFPIHLKQ